jgi:23S rRNA (cytosine1962-C5)-methyltransferase
MDPAAGFQRVLNCYCYTGGFTVAALAGGAVHVTSIDSSAPALERAAAHVALNGFDAGPRHLSGRRRQRVPARIH